MMFCLVVQWARCLFSRVEFLVEFKLAFELGVLDGASLWGSVVAVTGFSYFSIIRLGRESECYESSSSVFC